MRDILSLFISPERSMGEALGGLDKKSWMQGVIYCGMLAFLEALILVVSYKISAGWNELPYEDMGIQITNLLVGNMEEGLAWGALAGVDFLIYFFSAFFKIGFWSFILWGVGKLLKGEVKYVQIATMVIYTQVAWLAIGCLQETFGLFFAFVPIEILMEMITGILIVMEYWYLILLAIGFAIGTNETFLKAGVIVFAIQGVIWWLASISPLVQFFLG